jgi:hypothetical protein
VSDVVVPSPRDGGYHALKGFVFQFDKTLLDVFDGQPDQQFEVEGEQDLSTDLRYTQVKYRGDNFSLSAIAPAVRQIMAQYAADTWKSFVLYCYFPDKAAGTELHLEIDDLNVALGKDASKYEDQIKHNLLKNFFVRFSGDLEQQFGEVVSAIRKRYGCKTDAEAVGKHAFLHQHLTSLVLGQPFGARFTTPKELDAAVNTGERVIFFSAYENHLGRTKYITLLKEQFKHRVVNVLRRERLVVIECGYGESLIDLVNIAACAKKRFYVPEQSPPPYLVFRGIEDLRELKRELWDTGLKFIDGTHFDGDHLRIDDLRARPHRDIGLKLIEDARLDEFAGRLAIKEILDFFVTEPRTVTTGAARSRQIYVSSPEDIVKVLG